MNNNAKSLAARRAELVEQCAQQREYLAQECALLRTSLSLDGLRERLAGRGKLVLALAGVALGIAATRPKRLLSLGTRALAVVGAVRKFLPLLPR
jgi:hypothetical protein